MKKKILSLLTLGLCFSAISIDLNSTKVVNAANETKIEAFAHYEFNDASNPGKDSSKNGFDLKSGNTSSNSTAGYKAIDVLKDGNDNYLSLKRDRSANGTTNDPYNAGETAGNGGYLYAPKIMEGSNKDFSDMVTDSYTVSFTFRTDNTHYNGSLYALSFGIYNNCFTVSAYGNRIEIQLNNKSLLPDDLSEDKQQYCEKNLAKITSVSTADWTNLIVVGDSITSKCYVYLNNELKMTYDCPYGVKLTDDTTPSSADYTFAIGGQCNVNGASFQQAATVDVKDLQIYNCALSESNVAKVYNGQNPIVENQEDTLYITETVDFGVDKLDLDITDVNNYSNLIENSLPKKVQVNLSDNSTKTVDVFWYPYGTNTIRGYIQSRYLNPSLVGYSIDYNYVVKFDYNGVSEDKIRITNLTLDDKTFVPGSQTNANKHHLSFNLEVTDDVVFDGVYFDGDEQYSDDYDETLYEITFSGGALIQFKLYNKSATVTYMDGTNKLGTSTYTYNGSETLNSYPKDDYTFEGWFLDSGLTDKFTSLSYSTPSDVTLYAKYVKNDANNNNNSSSSDTNEPTSTKKGCKGGVTTSLFGLLTIAGSLLILKKRK